MIKNRTTFYAIKHRILKKLVEAQAYSDLAKGDNRLIKAIGKSDCYWSNECYSKKDASIMDALKLIVSLPNPGQINFWIVKGPDQNNYKSFIVYFDIIHYGKRHQISFHSFNRKLDYFVGKGRPTRWSKETSVSRNACFEIYEKSLKYNSYR